MDELREKRKSKLLSKAPRQMSEFLYAYHEASVGGSYTWEGDPPTGIVLITLGPSGPVVDWSGYITKDGLRLAERAIGDVLHPERPEIRKQSEEYYRNRAEEYERTHPVKCSHPRCSHRCKTEAGRKAHERACFHFKADREEGNTRRWTPPLQKEEK